jgi:hypothetical protein
MKPRVVLALVFLALLASRLCEVRILWPEEDLPLAAAVQMFAGKTLYRDVWFDKPPLVSSIYLLWGAYTGVPLRLACALFVFLGCWLLYRFAREMWGEREGLAAAGLLGFFLIFGIHAAVIPLAADLTMLVPHIAAVYLAWRGRPFWSGAAAGIALLVNSKAVFVLAACAVFQYRALPLLLAGFALPNAVALVWMAARGSLGAYYEEVWRLGALYASNTFLEHPILSGLSRTANWLGFHAALAVAAIAFWWSDRGKERWKLGAWAALSAVAVTAGWRFFPRYYLQLLPVLALVAARGFVLMGRKRAIAVAALLLAVPFIRFGPRYVLLAKDLAEGRPHNWSDVTMDQDSREAAALIREQAKPGDTLFVWGFRPDLYAYTRMPAGARFLESQPLSGIFADRHLGTGQYEPVDSEFARRNREELVRTQPSLVVDGLGPFNPRLSVESYPDLRAWMARYQVTGRTKWSVVYRRVPR